MPEADTAAPGTPAERADRFLASLVGPGEPGGALIVIRHGEILLKKAYGLADIEDRVPLTTEHLFHIGSIGKQFTAILVLMLCDELKLHLDDTIRRYLPQLPMWGDRITIRQLLNHTSGLSDYTDELQRQMTSRTLTPSNVDLVHALRTALPPQSEPGDRFLYSNPGYDLLGAIIERVTGHSYADEVESRIFGPLGMTHTFSMPNAERHRDHMIPHSYVKEEGAFEAYDSDPLDNVVGSGSVYSTLEDMARYDRALFGGRLLRPERLEQMLASGTLNSGRRTGYGFAFEVGSDEGRTFIAHDGEWLGFDSDYIHFPDQDLSVILLFNRVADIPDQPRPALTIARMFLT
ncbi:MAG: beta-lactamase family protein [Bacteroidetes bacterium]|nr:beta-lactamase family protein [Bacteroidota bacterium]